MRQGRLNTRPQAAVGAGMAKVWQSQAKTRYAFMFQLFRWDTGSVQITRAPVPLRRNPSYPSNRNHALPTGLRFSLQISIPSTLPFVWSKRSQRRSSPHPAVGDFEHRENGLQPRYNQTLKNPRP